MSLTLLGKCLDLLRQDREQSECPPPTITSLVPDILISLHLYRLSLLRVVDLTRGSTDLGSGSGVKERGSGPGRESE